MNAQTVYRYVEIHKHIKRTNNLFPPERSVCKTNHCARGWQRDISITVFSYASLRVMPPVQTVVY